jgi:diguanylate cyclase (GGDEF)-like protein
LFQALVISDAVRSADIVVASSDLVRSSLLDAGCTDVMHARSIDSGCSLLGKLQPDLIVLDLLEAPSYAVYRRLISRIRGIPLLVIVPESQMQNAFDAGVSDCIARPIRRTELVARACAAIRTRIERERRSRRDRRLTDEVRALQREKHDLERIVCVDSLTGVANRRHALALFDAEWKRSARDGNPVSLVMIDIDFFHAYNEEYGHPGGDACLRRVATEIASCLRRPTDYVGRYGGEEFIAVLANTDAAGARIVAERLRSAIEKLAIEHRGSQCSNIVSISVGFATMHPASTTSPEQLLQNADHALLSAKAKGRNRVIGEAPEAPARPRLSSQPWRRFPIVVADPWYASRIPQFLDSTRSDLTTARMAADRGSFDRIRTIARRLKGSASEHGIATIGELANLLDQAARSDDRVSVERVVVEIEAYVEHVQVAYRRPPERKLVPSG